VELLCGQNADLETGKLIGWATLSAVLVIESSGAVLAADAQNRLWSAGMLIYPRSQIIDATIYG
jgi:hypothetical protein